MTFVRVDYSQPVAVVAGVRALNVGVGVLGDGVDAEVQTMTIRRQEQLTLVRSMSSAGREPQQQERGHTEHAADADSSVVLFVVAVGNFG
eukprot:CAMPEP_0201117994 /NCGR_PEP_ID=MMETSP0850-20130426/2082_1 /ASSEMBLY_ACC=CAM_ASM_000622 /TAXON_ID=183588 /ORGANISM="Pseudo-nitzschia fraudulenta, Strain WWA7" /LENGTH=89 /DNA_ID=CAMNT_0047382849 /DNA_START=701 /DNA_END=970 /DNA_ORIENTATION=-